MAELTRRETAMGKLKEITQRDNKVAARALTSIELFGVF